MLTLKKYPLLVVLAFTAFLFSYSESQAQKTDVFHYGRLTRLAVQNFKMQYGSFDSVKRMIITVGGVFTSAGQTHYAMKCWILFDSLTMVDSPNLIDQDTLYKDTISFPFYFSDIELRKADLLDFMRQTNGTNWVFIGLEPFKSDKDYINIKATIYGPGDKVIATTVIGTPKTFNPSPPYKPQR